MGKKKRRIYMHKIVLKVPRGYVVDHRNRNKLDNRKGNLYQATHSQNAQNISKYRGISKYKNVSPSGNNKWRARLNHQHRRINIGTFDSELYAALAVDIQIELLKSNHVKNFPEGHPEKSKVRKILNEKGFYRPNKGSSYSTIPKDDKKYRGVKYLKDKRSYGAFIGYKGKRYKIGTRKFASEAALLYDSVAGVLYGDKAKLNFPNKEPIEHAVRKAKKILIKNCQTYND